MTWNLKIRALICKNISNNLKFKKNSDFKFKSCITDYVKITDSTGTYTSCGYKKFSFENKLCSSAIYITYKAPTSLSSIYRGFRIYYQSKR